MVPDAQEPATDRAKVTYEVSAAEPRTCISLIRLTLTLTLTLTA